MSDVESAVRELGLVVAKETERELVCSCPAHEERTGHRDTNPSLWVNREHGQFICRSCQFKGPFEALVRYLRGDGEDAQRFLEKSGGLRRRLNALMQETARQPGAAVQPETILAPFTDVPERRLRRRRLTAEAADTYGIRWHAGRRMWILPIRDARGHLIGFQAKGATSYFMYPKGLMKGDALFGLHTVTDRIIVVESPLDAPRIRAAGIEGAVATYGTSVTDGQLDRIFWHPERTVVLAMDNDGAGRRVTHEILRKFAGQGRDIRLYDYADSPAKDPGEQSDAEIISGVNNAPTYLQWKARGKTF
ncbi:toprim domain-containing protein [Streptomyces sp. NBC_00470]|uniref:toprim domain-containing protein n=1 Tax=Streptomyces sp. NBC_00470 TaxID=2975753 RepID=UPI0030E13B2D